MLKSSILAATLALRSATATTAESTNIKHFNAYSKAIQKIDLNHPPFRQLAEPERTLDNPFSPTGGLTSTNCGSIIISGVIL